MSESVAPGLWIRSPACGLKPAPQTVPGVQAFWHCSLAIQGPLFARVFRAAGVFNWRILIMNNNLEPSDESLRNLLRDARPTPPPPLPLDFQTAVWRRIEHAQTANESAPWAEWLDPIAAWLLQPRLALAGVAAMLLVGICIGLLQGDSLANDQAKQQYLAAVNPFTNR
jgi:hypothetical protein